jgi:hypothetical protein
MPDPIIVNIESTDKLISQIEDFEAIDFSPLMEEWRDILQTDNEQNLGIDAFGIPMDDVTYRPDAKAGTRKPIDYSILEYNNLTSGHYRTLGGPPLSPRGPDSRVTQNFRTDWDRDGNEWVTRMWWEDFLSLDSLQILPFHAEGSEHNPKLPIRDLLGIRPGAVAKARDALVKFVNKLLGRP